MNYIWSYDSLTCTLHAFVPGDVPVYCRLFFVTTQLGFTYRNVLLAGPHYWIMGLWATVIFLKYITVYWRTTTWNSEVVSSGHFTWETLVQTLSHYHPAYPWYEQSTDWNGRTDWITKVCARVTRTGNAGEKRDAKKTFPDKQWKSCEQRNCKTNHLKATGQQLVDLPKLVWSNSSPN